MPRGHRKTTVSKSSYLKLGFLLAEFFLVKIGQIPLFFLKLIFKAFSSGKKYILKPPLPKIPSLYHRRGRPRKTWFIPYYLNKFKFFFRKRIPLRTKVSAAGLLILIILYIYTSFIFTAAHQLPSPSKLISADKALTTEFLDRKGRLLYRMYEGRNRSLVTLEELPSHLIQATLATEDKNFYNHPGVDVIAIIRALSANIRNRADTQNLEGASTITQQLIKNALLTPEKTYTRKVKEIILALWTERVYTKDQILQMYINEAPYGGPTWGIEAAAQMYFNKSSRELTLSQSAFLAGLPASPTQFSPYGSNPELAKVRQKEVLRRMVENKYITQHQADIAFAEDLQLKPQIYNIKAPHFVMYVKDLLSQKFGQRVVSQGGLKITTTLDLDIQTEAEKIVSEETQSLASLNVKNAAAMITDTKTGQILAMVGSKDYHNEEFGSFNVAVAMRQPGSSIKVVTYATAFKQGFSPGNTILDVPVVFRDNWGNIYSPVNYDGKYHGPVSIRTALGSSYNIPAVKLLSMVGVDEMIQTAKDLGITTFTDPKRYGLSLTLGGGEVRMTDMMTLYGTLSQMGQKRVVTPILKVANSEGVVLEEYDDHPVQAITPEVAFLITDVLSDNKARTPAFGPNSLLKIDDKKVAVKTGTSDNKRDNWTFGYTPEYAVGVWVGNNDNSPMNQALASGVTGAAPIWNKITRLLVSKKGDIAFNKPEGIMEAIIDGKRDLVISQVLPKSLVRVTNKNNRVVFSDPFSSYASPSAQAAKESLTN